MSKNALPYYKAYPRDFIEGTIGMSFEEKGAYRLLLDLIYMKAGALVDDDRYIAGVMNLSPRKWNTIKKRLIELDKIQVVDGLLSNYRAIIELENLSKYQDKQSERRSKPNKNNELEKPRFNQPEPEPEYTTHTSASEVQTDLELVCSSLGKDVWQIKAGELVSRWVGELNLSLAEILEVAKTAKAKADARGQSIASLQYLNGAMQDLAGRKAQQLSPIAPSQPQRKRLAQGGVAGVSLDEIKELAEMR